MRDFNDLLVVLVHRYNFKALDYFQIPFDAFV
jgi:hypothetical protein